MSQPNPRPAPATSRGRYFDPALNTDVYKLLPAEYRATHEDVALVTLLGSCVAACIYDPLLGIGGMNHFMLPDAGQSGDEGNARYGAHAMELLINDILKLGGRRSRLNAKVFGGGNVLSGFQQDPVGTRNSLFVIDYLRTEQIPVMAQDLGDIHARKVCFFPRTARTLVRKLPATRQDDLVKQERLYRGRLASAPQTGSVELFQ